MFKRMLLALTFVAALGAAGVGTSSKAMAHGCGYGGYGYRAAYYPTYASYYSYGYAPRVAYYPPRYGYPVYYGGFDGGHHHRHHSGLTFTFGF